MPTSQVTAGWLQKGRAHFQAPPTSTPSDPNCKPCHSMDKLQTDSSVNLFSPKGIAVCYSHPFKPTLYKASKLGFCATSQPVSDVQHVERAFISIWQMSTQRNNSSYLVQKWCPARDQGQEHLRNVWKSENHLQEIYQVVCKWCRKLILLLCFFKKEKTKKVEIII